ncbi:MAG: hypothetical protein SF123_26215 [Chloroflexota bacterium]|nr:hypothetical protein [Chloroflexota bacterium]
MRKLTQRLYSAPEVQRMVRMSDWIKDDTLLERALNARRDKQFKSFEAVYVNRVSDEILLVYEHGGGDTRSREDFERFLADLQKVISSGPMHILEGNFPYGEDFPDKVPSLLQQVPTLFGVPPDDLDLSMESLKLLDKAFEGNDISQGLEDPYFAALMAYCGEAIRLATNGQWEMRRSDRFPDIWEPWIIPAVGLPISVADELFESLHEDIPFSLYGRMEAARFLSQPR